MEDDLEKEIDRSIITDDILLEIIPISDEKFGGSREIALENAKKAYIHCKTGFKKSTGKDFNETSYAKLFKNPISKKAAASLIRFIYYVHTFGLSSECSKKETQIFSETCELMHLYHEHLVDEEQKDNE